MQNRSADDEEEQQGPDSIIPFEVPGALLHTNGPRDDGLAMVRCSCTACDVAMTGLPLPDSVLVTSRRSELLPSGSAGGPIHHANLWFVGKNRSAACAYYQVIVHA
jgi:hypothetical protein